MMTKHLNGQLRLLIWPNMIFCVGAKLKMQFTKISQKILMAFNSISSKQLN